MADKVEDIGKEGTPKLTLNSFQKLPKSKVKSTTYDKGVQFNECGDTEEQAIKQAKMTISTFTLPTLRLAWREEQTKTQTDYCDHIFKGLA